jgi:hypothetical protein
MIINLNPGDDIQAAIDSLALTPTFSPGRIVLGPGQYDLTSPLNFQKLTNQYGSANGITLVGAGKYQTMLAASGQVIEWRSGSADIAKSFFKCGIRDLTLRTIDPQYTGITAALFMHDQLVIQDVSISTAAVNGTLLFADGVANSLFKGIEFNRGLQQLESPSSLRLGFYKNVIEGCQFVDGKKCLDLRDTNSNLITGNQFLPDGPTGWHIRFREDGLANTFANNLVKGNVLVDYSPGHRIIGNVIEGQLKLQGVSAETQFDRIVHVVANIIEVYTP